MLNLPEEVGFGANDNVRYTYDAAGNKRIKVVEGINEGNNTRLDYSGNFLYENNDLKAIFTSAGRIVPFNNSGETVYKFEYYLQDHLGNTRVVFSGHSNGMPEIMQVTDYYPFGMVMNQQNYFADGVLSNKFLYNGKELQDDELAGNSLGWYDYGARFYDPELGRWHSVDPMAHEREWLSPFNFVQNNTLNRIDPNGALDDGYQSLEGDYKWFDDETADILYKGEEFWLKVTDDRAIFDMTKAGVLDNAPEASVNVNQSGGWVKKTQTGMGAFDAATYDTMRLRICDYYSCSAEGCRNLSPVDFTTFSFHSLE